MSGPAPDPAVWAIVVAGGSGERFGGAKQFAVVAGRRVLDWSVAAARSVAMGVVAVVPADADAADAAGGVGADVVVAGGATRSASVRAGLAAVPASAEVVVVHDAARPTAAPAVFEAVVAAVRAGADGAVPGVDVTDSLRRREGGAVDHDELVAVQTPQAFRAACLRAAHAAAADASDDATLVEAVGGRIVVVDGMVENRKLTDPADLALLEQVLSERVQ